VIESTDLLTRLRAGYDWIERSRSPRTGGARAYYTPLRGWSRTYPEGTGCLLPTVLGTGSLLHEDDAVRRARGFGDFLLDIQNTEGGWHAGTWPPRKGAAPSVLATAQIQRGLCALHRHTGEDLWLEAALRSARWLAKTVGDDFETAYHTQLAWSLLEVWTLADDPSLRGAAIRILDGIRSRRTLFGAFTGWGFGGSNSAFTHTIGATLRGFVESARILDGWERYGRPVLVALRRLTEDALATNGRLPGAYDTDWHSNRRYTCLSGNAQIALCLLAAYEVHRNERFPQAARKLIEAICRHQRCDHAIQSLRGAVPGSHPLWGRYMRGRYPSWCVKYLCDAIVALGARDQEAVWGEKLATNRAANSQIAFTTM
jgi:hypothetical protein